MSEYERQYEDGSDPRVLDVIDVPVLAPNPHEHQTENWLLDPEFYWEKRGSFSPFDIEGLVEPVAPLWIDGYSTYHGRNDRIPIALADSVSTSLRLIRAEEVELAVFRPGEAFGNNKRRVQGRFHHAGREYALWVSDPVYERKYLAKLDDLYQLGECFLSISLAEAFHDACHKLIAAIIVPGTAP